MRATIRLVWVLFCFGVLSMLIALVPAFERAVGLQLGFGMGLILAAMLVRHRQARCPRCGAYVRGALQPRCPRCHAPFSDGNPRKVR